MSVIDARLKVVDYTQNNLRFHSKNAQEPQIKTQEGSKLILGNYQMLSP